MKHILAGLLVGAMVCSFTSSASAMIVTVTNGNITFNTDTALADRTAAYTAMVKEQLLSLTGPYAGRPQAKILALALKVKWEQAGRNVAMVIICGTIDTPKTRNCYNQEYNGY